MKDGGSLATAGDRRFAALCCRWMALGFFAAGLATLFDPALESPGRFWQLLLLEPFWFLTARWSLVLVALAGLGVADALRDDLARDPGRGAVAQWLFRIAQLSLFTTALVNVQFASIAVLYVRLDPQGMLWLGGLGVWALGSSLLALGGHQPRTVVAAGIALGLTLSVVPIAAILGNNVVWLLAVGLGSMVTAPLWLLLLGRHLGQPVTASAPTSLPSVG